MLSSTKPSSENSSVTAGLSNPHGTLAGITTSQKHVSSRKRSLLRTLGPSGGGLTLPVVPAPPGRGPPPPLAQQPPVGPVPVPRAQPHHGHNHVNGHTAGSGHNHTGCIACLEEALRHEMKMAELLRMLAAATAQNSGLLQALQISTPYHHLPISGSQVLAETPPSAGPSSSMSQQPVRAASTISDISATSSGDTANPWDPSNVMPPLHDKQLSKSIKIEQVDLVEEEDNSDQTFILQQNQSSYGPALPIARRI